MTEFSVLIQNHHQGYQHSIPIDQNYEKKTTYSLSYIHNNYKNNLN